MQNHKPSQAALFAMPSQETRVFYQDVSGSQTGCLMANKANVEAQLTPANDDYCTTTYPMLVER